MALALQDTQLIWRKVAAYFASANLSSSGTSPVAVAAFEALLKNLISRGVAQLQFAPFTEAQCDDDDGTGLSDNGACTLYGVYVKKVSAATDNYFKVYNNATVDTTATDQVLALPLLGTLEEAFEIHPGGLPLSVGFTVTQHTTSIGVTDGSDGGHGFLLIGAA